MKWEDHQRGLKMRERRRGSNRPNAFPSNHYVSDAIWRIIRVWWVSSNHCQMSAMNEGTENYENADTRPIISRVPNSTIWCDWEVQWIGSELEHWIGFEPSPKSIRQIRSDYFDQTDQTNSISQIHQLNRSCRRSCRCGNFANYVLHTHTLIKGVTETAYK
jgi:hypothetical protein